jgi:hypothetical protein
VEAGKNLNGPADDETGKPQRIEREISGRQHSPLLCHHALRQRRIWLAIVAAPLIVASLCAQEKRYYFFRPVSFGSDAMFNPVSLIANGGFDELQMYGCSNTLSDINWKRSAANVWFNITAPLPQINRYGWKKFVDQEILPTGFTPRNAQYFPNYTLHMIGGGMEYRKITEWYDYYGYPMPWACGAVTVMFYHYINEIIENGNSDALYSNVDPIADLLIFDPLGILLFSFDGVADFFSTNFSLNDWSQQSAFSFRPTGVRNTGQNFVAKYPISSSRKISVIYHFGSFGILGLSFKTNEEESISFGAGVSSKVAYNSNPAGPFTPAIIVGPLCGIYWDRDNSLLASLVVADSFADVVRASVYPGVFFLGRISPGVFCSVGRNGEFTAGLTASFLPLGISGRVLQK